MAEIQWGRETPLYAAASRGHAEVVRLLMEAGVDRNQATVCILDGWAPGGVWSSVWCDGDLLCVVCMGS